MLPDHIANPVELMGTDRALARERRDPMAEFACFATVDANGQPHARFVTLRLLDGTHVTFWADAASPKLQQLNANGKYELTAYWPIVARQYRLQGVFTWIAASDVPDEYAARPWRAKVWDWLHQDLPQSVPVSDRSNFVDSFQRSNAELELKSRVPEAVPPPAGAGLVRLEPRRVEIQHLDAVHRLHDRRLFVLDGGRWSQTVLVP